MFRRYDLRQGLLEDLERNAFPGKFLAWNKAVLSLEDDATHFGYVFDGESRISCTSGRFAIQTGMYFSFPGAGTIEGAGRGIIISRSGFRGVFHLGGPIETEGRLRYIDGCSDSLLIPPVCLGDPCLNLLHIPAGTEQSQHTHPSYRIGLIVAGSGECVTPEKRVALEPGLPFMIPANSQHSFYTKDSSLLVIAYHPDSDFGPTDDNHPMINRTYLSPLAEVRNRKGSRS